MSQIQETNGERLPLSFGQEQLWFIDQLAPGRSTYNVPVSHRLTGALDEAALRATLSTVVNRHESLRCTVHADDDGVPYLLAAPPGEVPLDVVDLTHLDHDTREETVLRMLTERANTPFDLSVGPLYRYTLFRLGPTDHLFSQIFHHIVTDGWSTGMTNAELTTAYRAFVAGETPQLEPITLRYADFAAQQRKQLAGGELEPQLEYWEKRLAALPALELPADRSRPAEQSFAGAALTIDLPDEMLVAARALAKQEGVSLFMLLSAALAALLTRYTGQEDVPFGITTLGRTDPDFEQLVGFFINMAVLRVDTTGDPAFSDLLSQVTDNVLDAFDNQDTPFELVVDRLQPVRDLGRNPLFVVALQVIDARLAATDLELPGLTAETVYLTNPVSRFDLALNFVELGDRLRVVAEYSADLFDPWRIEALIDHLAQLTMSACADPSLPISRLTMLAEPERAALLAAGRGEPLEYGPEPVHAVVARTAARQPDRPAAVFEGVELSYGELDRRADLIARYLRAAGIQHEQIVAVVVERDLDALVTFLGVLKSGGAFASLDPTNPPSRLEFMLRDTATPLVLTQSRLRDRIPESESWRIVTIDGDWDQIAAAGSDEPFEEWAGRDSLAYVLYTSGSTGQPKGVLIEHRALMSFVESYRIVFELVPEDRMLQLAAMSFDMSQGEIFAGLCVGATMVLVDQEAGTSPDALAALMREQRTSYICMSPAMLSLVEAGPYPHLRKIMAGAEAIPAEMVNKWNLDDRRLINVYGPTEATVGCTEYVCPHEFTLTPPAIGRPFRDRRFYIVDRFGNLVPRGVPGELLIGGEEGLARGYLNQPELTAAVFVDDPFHPGGRVYRTGDLIRWNRDHQMEFVGRVDNQIKLRGLRIELGEIEAALLRHPAVSMAAVALRPDQRGDLQLVGYVAPAGATPPAPADLKVYLLDLLPEYMIPAAWVVMDRLPVTTARKVNRAALPDPAPIEVADEFLAPATDTERAVVDVFTEVLGEQRIGADSGFFDIGGNSLQALRVVSRLNRVFDIKFKLRKLFGNPTVRGVAAVIDDLLAERSR